MYHYKACGLDNVWLENGYTEKETAYGKAVAVSDADQLHRLLAIQVASKSGGLSGSEVRFLRNSLLLSQTALGAMMGLEAQTVSLWERGNSTIPVAPEKLLRLLVVHKLDGNSDIEAIIERVNTVERLVNQRIVAKARDHCWTTDAPSPLTEICA